MSFHIFSFTLSFTSRISFFLTSKRNLFGIVSICNPDLLCWFELCSFSLSSQFLLTLEMLSLVRSFFLSFVSCFLFLQITLSLNELPCGTFHILLFFYYWLLFIIFFFFWEWFCLHNLCSFKIAALSFRLSSLSLR
jgi:hypothetical protein